MKLEYWVPICGALTALAAVLSAFTSLPWYVVVVMGIITGAVATMVTIKQKDVGDKAE